MLEIYQGGGAPNLLTPPIHAALVMNLRSCEDRRRPHPHGGQGVANGSNFKGEESKRRKFSGRRDLGATEEKDEGSKGRSPNLSF